MKPSDDLRGRVQGDLTPVRPLAVPARRALFLAPAALAAWAAAPALLGLRGDLPAIGPLLGWGASVVQVGLAIALIAAALREAVPADALPRQSLWLLLTAGGAITIALALATNAVSPEPGGRVETVASWLFCWRGVVAAGAPLLLLIALLAGRGLPMRPALMGALAGMASGAAVDGGWRLYCNYSEPLHVLLSHGGAVLALTIAGAGVGASVGRRGRSGSL